MSIRNCAVLGLLASLILSQASALDWPVTAGLWTITQKFTPDGGTICQMRGGEFRRATSGASADIGGPPPTLTMTLEPNKPFRISVLSPPLPTSAAPERQDWEIVTSYPDEARQRAVQQSHTLQMSPSAEGANEVSGTFLDWPRGAGVRKAVHFLRSLAVGRDITVRLPAGQVLEFGTTGALEAIRLVTRECHGRSLPL